MLSNPIVALILTLAIAFLWLRINDYFAHQGWISSQVSRKIIHIGTGPIFILCWLLFPDTKYSPYLAAVVPLIITLQFALVGLGIIKDPAAVKAMSRSGAQSEILRGPLYYGLVFVILTIVFWRETPIGMVALMTLCGGDGLADIIGKRLGKVYLPWSKRKTLVGSLTMFLGSFAFSFAIIRIYLTQGYFSPQIMNYIFPIALISIMTTLVESLPFTDIDNLTVPATAILMGYLVF
jgi:phytol kinase